MRYSLSIGSPACSLARCFSASAGRMSGSVTIRSNSVISVGSCRMRASARDHHKVAPGPSAATVHFHKFVDGASRGVIPPKPGRRPPPVIEIAKPATGLLAGFFERVKLLSLDKQEIVVPKAFAGHVFDAEDAFLCHGVKPPGSCCDGPGHEISVGLDHLQVG